MIIDQNRIMTPPTTIKAHQKKNQNYLNTCDKDGGIAPIYAVARSTRIVPRLSCLSARSLRCNKIPYNRKDLPETLHNFVSMQ